MHVWVRRIVVPALLALLLAYITQVAQQLSAPPSIFELAFRGQNEEIRQALAAGNASVTDVDAFGNSPLHWAAKGDRVSTVDLLLRAGANVSAVNRAGTSALHWAVAAEGKGDTARAILAAGATVNHQNAAGETALHWAVDWKRMEALTLLLHSSADPNLCDTKADCPLHRVDASCSTDDRCQLMVKELVRSGADPLAKNSFGRSLLDHFAAELLGPGLAEKYTAPSSIEEQVVAARASIPAAPATASASIDSRPRRKASSDSGGGGDGDAMADAIARLKEVHKREQRHAL